MGNEKYAFNDLFRFSLTKLIAAPKHFKTSLRRKTFSPPVTSVSILLQRMGPYLLSAETKTKGGFCLQCYTQTTIVYIKENEEVSEVNLQHERKGICECQHWDCSEKRDEAEKGKLRGKRPP